MPELPEVETVRRGIAPVLEGQRLIMAKAMRADLRVPIPKNFSKALENKRVDRVDRRSKYLLIYMEDGLVLILHLGMSGRITLYNRQQQTPPPIGKHDHLVFETENGILMVFNDPRRFGMAVFGDAATINQHPLLKNMGPEPISNAFHPQYLEEAFKNRTGSIKNILLNQKIIAGLGNIYVCEALFRSGIHPTRAANSLSKKDIEALVPNIVSVIRQAIEAGGSTLKDYAQVDGDLGYFQHSFQVYGRENESCFHKECKDTVARIVQSSRSTFYCPTCQQ